MKYKNVTEFVQALEEFDKKYEEVPGFPRGKSMKDRFWELGNELSDFSCLSWRLKFGAYVIIPTIIPFIFLLYSWENNNKTGVNICWIAIIIIALFIPSTIRKEPLMEAYRRQKKFAIKLAGEIPGRILQLQEDQEKNAQVRSKYLNCEDPQVYFPQNEVIPYLNEEGRKKYWEEKILAPQLESCNKVDEYIFSLFHQANEEGAFLKEMLKE
jgi:hypothetical protein